MKGGGGGRREGEGRRREGEEGGRGKREREGGVGVWNECSEQGRNALNTRATEGQFVESL